jgi:hypothetical protein
VKKALNVGSGKSSHKWSSVRGSAKRLLDEALSQGDQPRELLEDTTRWAQPEHVDLPTDSDIKFASRSMDPRLTVTPTSVWASAMSLKFHQCQKTVDCRVGYVIVLKGTPITSGDTIFLAAEKNYSLSMLVEYNTARVEGYGLIVKPRLPLSAISPIEFFSIMYDTVHSDLWVPSLVRASLRWTYSADHGVHALVVGEAPEFDLARVHVAPRARPSARGGSKGSPDDGGDGTGAESGEGKGSDESIGTGDADGPPPDAAELEGSGGVEVMGEEFLEALAAELAARAHGLGADEAEDIAEAATAEVAKSSGEAFVRRRERAIVEKAAKSGRISVKRVAARAEAELGSLVHGPATADEQLVEAVLHEVLSIGEDKGTSSDMGTEACPGFERGTENTPVPCASRSS